jgi:hypothetical protein
MTPSLFFNPKTKLDNFKEIKTFTITLPSDHGDYPNCWMWAGDLKDSVPVSDKVVNLRAYMYNKHKNANVRNSAKIEMSCKFYACINPDHMIVQKSSNKSLGSKNGASKLSMKAVVWIRENLDKPNKELAEKFNVSPKTIARVKKMEYWK